MELRDYLAALRRHWLVWVGATLVGALVALVVVTLTPKTYEATSRVFVAVSPEISNSANFVQSRVRSYPGLVTSEAVLAPVLEDLGLDGTLTDLRARVTAVNPLDTTRVSITVSGPDAEEAADIANAVAARFTEVVEELETPSSGAQPVTLTVSDPAVPPSEPVGPVALYVVALGVVAGLFLGLAAAVVRSRTDPSVHSEEDIRRVWGGDDVPELLVQARGRARRRGLAGRPATVLARRLEMRAEEGPVRVVLLSPSPAEERATRTFAEQVAAVLQSRGLDASVTGPEFVAGATGDDGPRVRLEVADPLAPLRVWKQVAERYDGVVLVVADGRVDGTELKEMSGVLRSAGITPLAIALVSRRRGLSARVRGRRAPGPMGPRVAEVAPSPRDGQRRSVAADAGPALPPLTADRGPVRVPATAGAPAGAKASSAPRTNGSAAPAPGGPKGR